MAKTCEIRSWRSRSAWACRRASSSRCCCRSVSSLTTSLPLMKNVLPTCCRSCPTLFRWRASWVARIANHASGYDEQAADKHGLARLPPVPTPLVADDPGPGAGQFERPRRRAWRVPPCLRDRAAFRDTGRGSVVGDSTGREAEVASFGSRVAEQTDLARARRLRGDQGVSRSRSQECCVRRGEHGPRMPGHSVRIRSIRRIRPGGRGLDQCGLPNRPAQRVELDD